MKPDIEKDMITAFDHIREPLKFPATDRVEIIDGCVHFYDEDDRLIMFMPETQYRAILADNAPQAA